ncbi:Calcipressin-domain-containing protein [Xylariaceae sp. FL0594]|nr:Calcipressin-domain-containing protein [Xylariaceae sp. FL0594]
MADSPSTPASPTAPLSLERPLLERRGSSRSSLSLDISSIPPLTQPTPATNTLLITNLNDLDIFRPDNLQTIRELIEASAPIYTWSPLKSFRRIVVSFLDEQAAIKVRSIWDGEAIMGERCRVYFGQHTPLDLSKDNHLNLPDAGKLFFISPPPSPPHGWEMRLEDAPNKQVHAQDLAEALAKLHHNSSPTDNSPISPADASTGAPRPTRSRSSTLIYQPGEHGGSPHLPAISVDDMTDEPMDMSPAAEKPVMAHTTRPPVELME